MAKTAKSKSTAAKASPAKSKPTAAEGSSDKRKPTAAEGRPKQPNLPDISIAVTPTMQDAEKVIQKAADEGRDSITRGDLELLTIAGFTTKTLRQAIEAAEELRRQQRLAGTKAERERLQKAIADARAARAEREPILQKQIADAQHELHQLDAEVATAEADAQPTLKAAETLRKWWNWPMNKAWCGEAEVTDADREKLVPQ